MDVQNGAGANTRLLFSSPKITSIPIVETMLVQAFDPLMNDLQK